ncbi:TIGR02678 family protein [Egibacter rhizosphaerae]|uniref:TIGR02678 family protein n=2 Tax=Egibacter rhizosphaerae TaxID=1670831 RepID=A0A411YLH3_9ACTN|nr:TIGR02678 family protein [Egibacter rhizosphaerae]
MSGGLEDTTAPTAGPRSSAGALDDARSQARAAELARARRALLRHPLLTEAGPDPAALTLVRRHASELRAWFAEETGWQLLVGPESARLRKTPADLADASRPARSGRGHPAFSRRRYVLLCLALTALERLEQQTTLGLLADQVLGAASDPALAEAGISFTMERRDERSDLVAVVRLLLAHGVLAKVAGDEQAYLDERGDALYDVDRRVLATVLASPRGPSTIAATDHEARLAAVTGQGEGDTEPAGPATIRRRLARRLLDDPVVYTADLEPDEQAYLTTQRPQLARRLAEPCGLVPELRAEGTALLDPTGEATDAGLPEEGTDGHATLLLAERLAAEPDRWHGVDELEAHTAALAAEHATHWRKAAQTPEGARDLCRGALDRLAGLRLAERNGDAVRALPALCRYAADEPTVTQPRQQGLLESHDEV